MKKLALALALVLLLPGCEHTKALYQTARDNAMTAGPPSVAAVLTSPLGPAVQFTLVFLTALVSKAFTDTAALRTGELVGEAAIVKENERLNATLQAIQGDLEFYAGKAASLGTDLDLARGKVSTFQRLWAETKRLLMWLGTLILAFYLLGGWRWWRNAFRWYRLSHPWLAVWSVLHALCRPLPDPPLAPAPGGA